MHTLMGVFRSFSLLSVRLLSLLNLNFRTGYTFKSRMCRGIVGDAKTTCASQPLLHSINRCITSVMSLQTSPMIKKLEITLPVTRASFLAETLLQDIISTTSSRIPEIFPNGMNIQLFLKSQKIPSQQMT